MVEAYVVYYFAEKDWEIRFHKDDGVKMGAIIRFLIISAVIVIPWGIIGVTNLEINVIAFLKKINLSDTAIMGLMVIPPIAFFTIKWLFEPRITRRKRFPGQKDIIIKFRG